MWPLARHRTSKPPKTPRCEAACWPQPHRSTSKLHRLRVLRLPRIRSWFPSAALCILGSSSSVLMPQHAYRPRALHEHDTDSLATSGAMPRGSRHSVRHDRSAPFAGVGVGQPCNTARFESSTSSSRCRPRCLLGASRLLRSATACHSGRNGWLPGRPDEFPVSRVALAHAGIFTTLHFVCPPPPAT